MPLLSIKLLKKSMYFSLLVGVILSSNLMAEMYRWVDENGNLQFSDTPPAKVQADEQLEVTPYIPPALNSFESTVPPRLPNTTRNHTTKKKASQKPYHKQLPPYAGNKSVTMYSASWCGACWQAKAYMNARRIPYTEYDIEASEQHMNQFRILGGRGVPLMLVGKQRLSGFSAGHLEQLLAP